MKRARKPKDEKRKLRIERAHKLYGTKPPEKITMEEKLLLDQPPTVGTSGTVEFVVTNPDENDLITEEPMDGIELLNG